MGLDQPQGLKLLPDRRAALMSSPMLVFTTDFGLSDSYAGVMKGVALGINPNLQLIDLTHQIPPQNIAQGAFALGVSYRFFHPDAIHVAVVDPGVGTSRRPVLLQTPHGTFVAPDNGLLSRVLADFTPVPVGNADVLNVLPPLRAFNLTNPDYWLHPVSSTFHGRDIFTPVAAHLSAGVAPEELGERVGELAWLPMPSPRITEEYVRGEIVYCDVYGNLVSNIPAEMLAERSMAEVRIRGRSIHRLSATFLDTAGSAGLVALFGSHGYLEVAVPNGSAAALLSVGPGEPITVNLAT